MFVIWTGTFTTIQVEYQFALLDEEFEVNS